MSGWLFKKKYITMQRGNVNVKCLTPLTTEFILQISKLLRQLRRCRQMQIVRTKSKSQKIVLQRGVLPPGRSNYYHSWCLQFLGILRRKY
jgi:hypothetical protein